MKQRIHVPHVRFTEAEIKKLKEDYGKTNFSSFSAFLRFMILSKKVDIKYSPSDDALAREMGERNRLLGELHRQILKIGININQIAKKINSQQYVMREDIDLLFKNFSVIEDMIKKFS